jgi:hypothetical protein
LNFQDTIMRQVACLAFAAASVLAAPIKPAAAAGTQIFRSPTGNLVCIYSPSLKLGDAITCVGRNHRKTVTLGETGRPSVGPFTGRGIRADGRTLPYGAQRRFSGKFFCASGTLGIGCSQLRDGWGFIISKAGVRVFQPTAPVPAQPSTNSGVYCCPGSGHWVQDKSDDGSVVTLEDGSTWLISLLDRIDTSLWLPAENVVVQESGGGYRLINADSGDVVEAAFLGS